MPATLEAPLVTPAVEAPVVPVAEAPVLPSTPETLPAQPSLREGLLAIGKENAASSREKFNGYKEAVGSKANMALEKGKSFFAKAKTFGGTIAAKAQEYGLMARAAVFDKQGREMMGAALGNQMKKAEASFNNGKEKAKVLVNDARFNYYAERMSGLDGGLSQSGEAMGQLNQRIRELTASSQSILERSAGQISHVTSETPLNEVAGLGESVSAQAAGNLGRISFELSQVRAALAVEKDVLSRRLARYETLSAKRGEPSTALSERMAQPSRVGYVPQAA